MTREERHIAVLNIMLESMDVYDSIQPTTERKKAIKAAIQALSQEPTEKPMTVDEMEREYEKSKALFHKIVECDDAISRDAVCNIVNDIRNCISVEGYWAILERLKKLPSVTQKCEKCAMNGSGSKYCDNCGQKSGKWIPCSERLPEDRDWYLGIFKEMDTGWINPLPFICDYVGTKTKFTTEDFWIIRCGSDREDGSSDYYKSLRCVAWMPLPEPYEPQESEDKE